MRRRRSVAACVWRSSANATPIPATLRKAASPSTTGRKRSVRRISWTWRASARRWSAVEWRPNRKPTWSVWWRSTREPWLCPSVMERMTSTWSRVSQTLNQQTFKLIKNDLWTCYLDEYLSVWVFKRSRLSVTQHLCVFACLCKLSNVRLKMFVFGEVLFTHSCFVLSYVRHSICALDLILFSILILLLLIIINHLLRHRLHSIFKNYF